MRRLVGWAFALAAAAALLAWYAWRPQTDAAVLLIPVATYAPGTVRLDQGVWVSRLPDGEFFIFLDRDPHRGQRLNWDENNRVFAQAAIYRPDGSCITGPCSAGPGNGLYRVEARLQGDTLVVYPGRIISGGLEAMPAWVSELRRLFGRARPAAPPSVRP